MANSFFFSILMLFLVALMIVPQGFANSGYLKPDPRYSYRPQYPPGTPTCDPNNRGYPCRRGGPPTHL
ncbi:hypothetical protein MtrunA17_Chr3g0083471 [Medicago truncatula]|uniref:Transmembrane protein n=1 Tax=Medicago truncatula TaxID=3880 RepID=A0A396IJG3_MEDTR|nr:hypothetical protein MtrunA17_Chr3g0083471 [Medicago truncatula]